MKITSDSHVDHALTPQILDSLRAKFASRAAFFIETFKLHESLGTLPCNLHGPAVSEDPVLEPEVSYQPRGSRAYNSRLCQRPELRTRTVTVIAGPHKEEPCILYTAFGEPLSPKEPADPTLKDEEREESEVFWSQHALSL